MHFNFKVLGTQKPISYLFLSLLQRKCLEGSWTNKIPCFSIFFSFIIIVGWLRHGCHCQIGSNDFPLCLQKKPPLSQATFNSHFMDLGVGANFCQQVSFRTDDMSSESKPSHWVGWVLCSHFLVGVVLAHSRLQIAWQHSLSLVVKQHSKSYKPASRVCRRLCTK